MPSEAPRFKTAASEIKTGCRIYKLEIRYKSESSFIAYPRRGAFATKVMEIRGDGQQGMSPTR